MTLLVGHNFRIHRLSAH